MFRWRWAAGALQGDAGAATCRIGKQFLFGIDRLDSWARPLKQRVPDLLPNQSAAGDQGPAMLSGAVLVSLCASV